MRNKSKLRFYYLFSIAIITFLFTSCLDRGRHQLADLSSPNEKLKLEVHLNNDGKPFYTLEFNKELVIDTSYLGMDFRDQAVFGRMKLQEVIEYSKNETWEMPWGEQRIVEDHFNAVILQLEESEAPKRKLDLHFKLFNDGLGFRYEIPEMEGADSLIIINELTEFKLTGDHDCWWIPGDWDIYEHLYNKTKVSRIDAISKRDHPNLAQTYIPYNAVNTPVTMKTSMGNYLSFHEADLTDYSGMTLVVDTAKLLLTSELVGSKRHAYKAKVALPFHSPWRTIQVSEKAGDLVESKMILNLNESNKLGDVSWFKPMKYVGIWWEMHLGLSSWGMEGGKHGATTENTKRYIDFAAKNNIGGVLVEGWNKGWENWIGTKDREGNFDFVTPYPDYKLEEVVNYANDKGVEIIMHHETSAAPRTYDKQKEAAFALMQKHGMHTVKTGYVGQIIPEGEYHHGQWMVKHYRRVIETAAKYQVAVNAHEPIKATGIRRTFPNTISREGLRGQEFNAWASDGGNPPEHISNVVFTRMLGGPIDFTPGAFEMSLPTKKNNKINTTLAHQLALYVLLYSPVQMACDLPEHYAKHPAFQFIRDVGVDWEQSKVLDGDIGDFAVIARQERESRNWFIGAVTDENSRMIELNFDFLDDDKKYYSILYRDGERAGYNKVQTDVVIDTLFVDKSSKLKVFLAEGGGMAMSLME